jgi:mono/diheme cytochrome c family protein
VLVAITNAGKLGLGLVAGVFIVFALLSSFYFPRRDPNFPGNRLGLFTLITVLLFIVTMAGVIVFAKEEEEAHGAEAAETQPAETGEEPATTGEEPATTGEEPATTGEEPAEEPAGDAAAGEAVFSSAGCGSCHTLEAAGASGTVGPNLDEAKPDAALVVDRVTNGMGAMPAFGSQLDEQQIQDVAAYVVASTQG